jgi:hypothetical protein
MSALGHKQPFKMIIAECLLAGVKRALSSSFFGGYNFNVRERLLSPKAVIRISEPRQHNHRVLPRQIRNGRSFYGKPWGVGKSVVKSFRIDLKSAPLWMGTNYATEELR